MLLQTVQGELRVVVHVHLHGLVNTVTHMQTNKTTLKLEILLKLGCLLSSRRLRFHEACSGIERVDSNAALVHQLHVFEDAFSQVENFCQVTMFQDP